MKILRGNQVDIPKEIYRVESNRSSPRKGVELREIDRERTDSGANGEDECSKRVNDHHKSGMEIMENTDRPIAENTDRPIAEIFDSGANKLNGEISGKKTGESTKEGVFIAEEESLEVSGRTDQEDQS